VSIMITDIQQVTFLADAGKYRHATASLFIDILAAPFRFGFISNRSNILGMCDLKISRLLSDLIMMSTHRTLPWCSINVRQHKYTIMVHPVSKTHSPTLLSSK